MSIEVLLLALACGMTILAYMIAINAHGPTRLSLSYLMATVMLAGTVWGIVQYVNTDLDARKMEELKRLESEKKKAEARIQSQEEALRANKERMEVASQLNAIITSGTGLASTMINIDLQDRGMDLEILMGKASAVKQKTEELKNDFEKISSNDTFFNEPVALLEEAMKALIKAAYYYRSFYYSEDSEQEDLRERVLRQKARAAYDTFQKASAMIASSGSK
jgi:nitric oxide reductase large subunit